MTELPDPSLPTTDQGQRTNDLPEMTRQEASFHASAAGVRAAKEAEAQGCDPSHALALGAGATGGKVIHGVTLPLPCAYSALAVPALSGLLEKYKATVSGLQSDCLFIASFARPKEVYQAAVIQADADAVKYLLSLADEIALELLHRDHIDAAVAWCMEAFQRLNGVKKPPVAATPDPVTSPPIASDSSGISPATASAPDPAG